MMILSSEDRTEDEIRMVYDYLLFLDYDTLFSYFFKNTLPIYENDLFIYLEVVNKTIKIFEKSEEYEKCYKLKIKRDEALEIIKSYKNK